MTTTRRHAMQFLVGSTLVPADVACAPSRGALQEGWETFKRRFMTSTGRIVDTGNGGVSHSEGQGYGMLLAEACDDARSFRLIWDWTRKNLQVRDDALFAWQWKPHSAEQPVPDRNNATDGDILVAWSLQRGADRWGKTLFSEQAEEICRAIKRRALLSSPRADVILPATNGFIHQGVATLNLSYWIFPALQQFGDQFNETMWKRLVLDGLEIIERARFGRWHLPPDWLLFDQDLAPSPLFAPRFSYDAVRIPLYLIWAGFSDTELLWPFIGFWQSHAPHVPAEVNLLTDEVSSYQAPGGIMAIKTLTTAAVSRQRFTPPLIEHSDDYYSAVLKLLTTLALIEQP